MKNSDVKIQVGDQKWNWETPIPHGVYEIQEMLH